MKQLLNTIILLLLVILFLIGILHPVTDFNQDLGRHLLTGNLILSTQKVPFTNLFSYTYPTFPFLNSHWLSEVVFSFLFQHFGIVSLFLLKLILLTFSLGILFFPPLKQGRKDLWIFTFLFLSISVIFERTAIRPELFSFLFLSFMSSLLYHYRTNYPAKIFILIPLQLLFVNMHIYAIIGIILIVCFWIHTVFLYKTSLLPLLTSTKKFPQLPSSFLTITILLFSSLVISLLNPSGLQGLLYPFFVFQNYGYSIEENQNILFLWNYSQKQSILFFVALVTFTSTCFLLTIKKTQVIDWLLLLFFSYIGYLHVRNIPLFVYALTPSFLYLSQFIRFNPFQIRPLVPLAMRIILILLICISLYTIIQKRPPGYRVSSHAENAVSFFIQNKLSGPLFNNFDIGSYLIYRLYPKEKVFIDGRPEAYPASFFQSLYIPMQQYPDSFDHASQQFKFQTIFFAHTDQTPWAASFLKTIIKNPQWNLIYLDPYVVIFSQDNSLSLPIITASSYRITTKDTLELLYLSRLFSLFSWPTQEKRTYELLLENDPTNCQIRNRLGLLLEYTNDPLLPFFIPQFEYFCK